METTDLIVLVAGAVLGFGIAWLFKRGSVKQELHERTESRLAAANGRVEAAEADRRAISGRALELQRALRAERSLLDGVAARAGIAPHDFRSALARDVLHRPDPYRARYLDEPIELDRRVGQLAGMKLDTRAAEMSAELGTVDVAVVAELKGQLAGVRSELDRRKTELDQVIEESRILAGELASTEHELAAIRASMERPREPAHWTDPSRRLASFIEEVAELRVRLADRSIERDELARRRAQLADVDRLLAYFESALDRLRDDIVHRSVPASRGE
ncbi:MAG: hypothetical protein O3C27_14290 [Actinomycetota bacterium]|nr:hypothetical protein [Actinomycetota bacterium]